MTPTQPSFQQGDHPSHGGLLRDLDRQARPPAPKPHTDCRGLGTLVIACMSRCDPCVSLALLSVTCVSGAWGLGAGVIELLINSESLRNFLQFPRQKSGQGTRSSEGSLNTCLLSGPTGVLPAGGRHGSPSPGARETPGCGHSAGRGELGPSGWEVKGHQNRS